MIDALRCDLVGVDFYASEYIYGEAEEYFINLGAALF